MGLCYGTNCRPYWTIVLSTHCSQNFRQCDHTIQFPYASLHPHPSRYFNYPFRKTDEQEHFQKTDSGFKSKNRRAFIAFYNLLMG